MSSPTLLHMNGTQAVDQLRKLNERNALLERAVAELNEEVALLTAERDELLDALRDRVWATPEERMELLVDQELAMLRHELALTKGEQSPKPTMRATQQRKHHGRRCA